MYDVAQIITITSYASNPPAEAPIMRKHGEHNGVMRMISPTEAEAPQSDEKKQLLRNEGISNTNNNIPSHKRTSIESQNEQALGSDGYYHGHHHHSFDRSMAAGGVIVGGLATAFMVAVFCYIRATRRFKAETTHV
ncbi:hypothetical protein G2W53_016776 [Senna tora]|uniref:Uncharacterized protein n=1 Tax=Senna tora TaxID=362788 RepID=A0A834TQU9_9FABA|nr:hypothetical protein G2W53_016776 [Senna tora]